MRNRSRGTKLEAQFQKRKGRFASESEHTLTVQTNRGRQLNSKPDVAKTQPTSASYNPETAKQRGDSKSREQKIAALKYPEQQTTKAQK